MSSKTCISCLFVNPSGLESSNTLCSLIAIIFLHSTPKNISKSTLGIKIRYRCVTNQNYSIEGRNSHITPNPSPSYLILTHFKIQVCGSKPRCRRGIHFLYISRFLSSFCLSTVVITSIKQPIMSGTQLSSEPFGNIIRQNVVTATNAQPLPLLIHLKSETNRIQVKRV